MGTQKHIMDQITREPWYWQLKQKYCLGIEKIAKETSDCSVYAAAKHFISLPLMPSLNS